MQGCNEKLPINQAVVRSHVRAHYANVEQHDDGSDGARDPTAGGTKPKSKAPQGKGKAAEDKTKQVVGRVPHNAGTPEETTRVVCTYEPEGHPEKRCNRTFDSVGDLTRHIECVHYEWRYVCPLCKELFARRDSVQLERKGRPRGKEDE